MLETATPASVNDETNRRILAVSEDQLSGFHPDPFGEIAQRSGVDVDDVIERVRAMLTAGSIRRVRQTLLSTRLAASALVAWRLPPERLDAAFDYMFADDPFSGHVVIRTTDAETPRSATTASGRRSRCRRASRCRSTASCWPQRVGAEAFRIMPAKRLFALGVGHVRRREHGARQPAPTSPAASSTPNIVRLSDARVARARGR